MDTRKGNLYILLAAIFWSLNAPLVRFINVQPLFISCYRSLIAGFILLPFLKFQKIKFNRYLFLYLFSYLGLCSSITVAIKNTSSSIAIGMQYASVLWIFLINYFIFKNKESEKIPAIFLITIGVILFMSSGENGSNFGNFIAFLESIFFTIMTITSKKVKGLSPLGLTSLGNLFTGIILFFVIGSSNLLILSLSKSEYIIILILGIVQVALGYGFYNLGLKYTSSQNAALISVLEMILGPLWVLIFLKEYSNTKTIVGFSFIVVGLLLSFILSRIKLKKEPVF